MSLGFQPMRHGFHHTFRFNISRTYMSAFVTGNTLPDNFFVSKQFLFHAQTGKINPVAWIEVRIDGIDRARVGAGTALPATVDVLPAGKRGNFIFEILVVIVDNP